MGDRRENTIQTTNPNSNSTDTYLQYIRGDAEDMDLMLMSVSHIALTIIV